MALLQQVSYVYAISLAMEPLRGLLKPKTPWVWTAKANNAFLTARDTIAKEIEQGVTL